MKIFFKFLEFYRNHHKLIIKNSIYRENRDSEINQANNKNLRISTCTWGKIDDFELNSKIICIILCFEVDLVSVAY